MVPKWLSQVLMVPYFKKLHMTILRSSLHRCGTLGVASLVAEEQGDQEKRMLHIASLSGLIVPHGGLRNDKGDCPWENYDQQS